MSRTLTLQKMAGRYRFDASGEQQEHISALWVIKELPGIYLDRVWPDQEIMKDASRRSRRAAKWAVCCFDLYGRTPRVSEEVEGMLQGQLFQARQDALQAIQVALMGLE